MEKMTQVAQERQTPAKVDWFPILMYHRVVPRLERPDPYGLCVSLMDFEAQMAFLHGRGYRVVPLEELTRQAAGGHVSPKHVALTFDDGYMDTHRQAFPVLKKYGFPATVFLVASNLNGSNAWDRGKVEATPLMGLSEIREMARHDISFGSHSLSHRSLPDLAPSEARNEIVLSRKLLQDAVGAEIPLFCFPYGRSTLALREAVQDAGYAAACGIEKKWEHALFNLSRIDVARCRSSRLLWRSRISGRYSLLRRYASRLRRAVLPLSEDIARAMD